MRRIYRYVEYAFLNCKRFNTLNARSNERHEQQHFAKKQPLTLLTISRLHSLFLLP